MVRIAFDVDDLAGFRVGAADQPAGHRAVIAEREGLFRILHPVDLMSSSA